MDGKPSQAAMECAAASRRVGLTLLGRIGAEVVQSAIQKPAGRRRQGVYSKLHDIVALHRTLELLPAAAYTCDHEGRITYFNHDAARIWGRKPALDDPAERWCGSARLLTVDGQSVPHEQSWMAQAIADKREHLGEEAIVERPDHTQVPVLMYVTPILDEDGSLMAAVNILVNISQRKRIETLLERANATKDLYRIALADALRSELASMLRTIHGARGGDRDPEAMLQKLERNIGHMKAVVDELVDSPDRPQSRPQRAVKASAASRGASVPPPQPGRPPRQRRRAAENVHAAIADTRAMQIPPEARAPDASTTGVATAQEAKHRPFPLAGAART